jgi:MraZ protein
MFFFSGSQTTKVDDKGRIVLPQSMRFGLVEEGKLEFTIGLGIGGCLSVYRNSEIERIVEVFRKKQHVPKYRKFFTLFFSTLHQTSCDKLGRVSMPQNLRRAAKIEGEVVVAGVLGKIEIWPKEKYEFDLEEFLEGGDFVDEAFALLQEEEEEEEEKVENPLAVLGEL